MKTREILKIATLSVSLTMFTGCLHIDLGGGRPHHRPKPVDQIIIVPDPDSDRATIAEIDAAMKLGFDHAKTSALKAIAKREHLSPAAQVHLVGRGMTGISFANMQFDVMEALVKNPAFCSAAKETMLSHIDRLSFESYKRRLLEAINKAAVAPPRPAPPEQQRDQPVVKKPGINAGSR